ncbi:MAG TPA: S-layer protein, partial [Pirellulaceae bacterium]|nr:S-layer protein [Pirellulaceae bacterium]
MRIPRLHAVRAALLSAALLALAAPSLAAENAPAAAKPAPGLGDPGQLKSISLETGRAVDGGFVLSGRDSSQQLVVTGQYSTGQTRDLSRSAKYIVSPEGIVAIDATGFVTPVK